MKIKIGFRGVASDTGSHFFYEAELDVTDETAEYAGRDFARLVFLAERGMVDAQKVAYRVNTTSDLWGEPIVDVHIWRPDDWRTGRVTSVLQRDRGG